MGLTKHLYVIVGIPASGKTTLSNDLAQKYDATAYHFDDIPDAHNPKKTKNAHKQMWADIAKDIVDGHNVICDDLHTRLEWRQDLLSALQDIPCKKILIVMTTPLEECIRRNAQRQGRAKLPDFVIYHLNQRYQPPSLDEGWDDIQYI